MLNTFEALRIYGPLTKAQLMGHTGLSEMETVAQLGELFTLCRATVVHVPYRRDGRPDPERSEWDVTPTGLAVFDQFIAERKALAIGECVNSQRGKP